MSIVVNVDNKRLSIDVRELALAGFSLVQLTSFSARQYEVLKPLKDHPHHGLLTQDRDVRTLDLVNKDKLIRSLRSALSELEEQGYIRHLQRQ